MEDKKGIDATLTFTRCINSLHNWPTIAGTGGPHHYITNFRNAECHDTFMLVLVDKNMLKLCLLQVIIVGKTCN